MICDIVHIPPCASVSDHILYSFNWSHVQYTCKLSNAQYEYVLFTVHCIPGQVGYIRHRTLKLTKAQKVFVKIDCVPTIRVPQLSTWQYFYL
jgi:hypothetical protein